MKNRLNIFHLICAAAVLLVTASAAGGLPAPTVVWVDDDWTGPGDCGGHTWDYDAFATVQEGVDAVDVAGTVYLQPGLYPEQVVIGKDDLHLIGTDPLITQQTIIMPAVVEQTFLTGHLENRALVLVQNAHRVQIMHLRVDGDERADENPRSIGIAFHNADGLISDCIVSAFCNDGMTALANGIGIMAFNNSGESYSVDIMDTHVVASQFAGMMFLGKGLDVTVSGCEVDGWGQTATIAQRGIYFGNAATGTVSECLVYNHRYTGGPGAAAIGFMVEEAGPVLFKHSCTSSSNQIGFLFQNANGAIRESYIDGLVDRDRGIVLMNPSNRTTPGGPGGVMEMSDIPTHVETRPMEVEITGCDVWGFSTEGSIGVEIRSLGGVINALMAGNQVHDWGTGVLVEGDTDPIVQAYSNHFYDNTDANVVDNSMGTTSSWCSTGVQWGNYWDDYEGHEPYPVDGSAGSVDCHPNPSVYFTIEAGPALVECNGSATATVWVGPVASLQSYQLMFYIDPARWNTPVFTKLLDMTLAGEWGERFDAHALGAGWYSITHSNEGSTSGYTSGEPTPLFNVAMTMKTGSLDGVTNVYLKSVYGGQTYPKVYDPWDTEVESSLAVSTVPIAVDCTAPRVDELSAMEGRASGDVPSVLVRGQESPAAAGSVTRLWYQYRPEGEACSTAPSAWQELAPVTLPGGSWTTNPTYYQPSAPPSAPGTWVMYVMAEDAAGNLGGCAKALGITFEYGPFGMPIEPLIPDETGLSGRTVLGRALPNPFNPRTTISFGLAQTMTVRLTVFDVAGRQVRTLVEGEQSAGVHHVEWDGRDDAGHALGTGVYFTKMRAGSYQSQQRMTLLK